MPLNLTKVIIGSKLTANRVYYLLAKLKIKPNERGVYQIDTIKRLLEEHESCSNSENECYYREK